MLHTHISTADVLDIIFDGRNKQYGAYQLRKSYNKRLTKALLLTGAFVLLVFLSAVFAGFKKSDNNAMFETSEHALAQVIPETPVTPPLPPPEKIVVPEPLNTVKFSNPVVVDDSKAADSKIETIDDNQIIGTETIKTDNTRQIIDAPIDEPNSTVFETPRQDEEDKIHLTVQHEAQFPGGDAAWARYLQKVLSDFNAEDDAVPPGTYKVWVRFIVSKSGKVSEVQAETNFGYGLEARAVAAIKNGPDWKPAMQNGHQVNAYRKQPVLYVIGE
jgi:periplasmic protein TonB